MKMINALTLGLMLAFLAAATPAPTRRNHYKCAPYVDGNPTGLGYKSWCQSEVFVGSGKYMCGNDDLGDGSDHLIADWGVLHPNVLEFAVPCGRKFTGYGVYTDHGDQYCAATNWIVSYTATQGGQPRYFYLNLNDDCEAPDTLTSPPYKTEVFYRT